METISGIYEIRNTIDNKVYIGSSKDIIYRWRSHRSELRGSYHSNTHLQNAWNKYGESNFRFTILEQTEIESLLNKEDEWFEKTGCLNKEFGYNISEKAGCPNHSEETKEKIRAKKIGVKLTPEHKEKISKSLIGNTRTKGRPLSEDHKNRQSISLLKYYNENEVSQETREKLRVANTGKKASVETREKLRISHLGKGGKLKYTDEQVAEFKKEIANGSSQSEVARKYNVSFSTMSYVLHKRK